MRVGVIVAARAPVPYLGEALGSVLDQNPPPAVVVVVDHASTPPLAAPQRALLVRLDDPAGGPAAARQAGLAALGDCDLIALADADDCWEPGKLAAQIEALESHPTAAVCFGRARVIDAAGRPTGERLPELAPGLHEGAALVQKLYAACPIPAASAVVRRTALEQAGGFVPAEPLPAGTDWDLWLRLALAGRPFLCEPRARIAYRRHPGGLTSDVTRLGQAGLAIHRRYAHVADAETGRRMQSRDLCTVARGRIRERRFADAAEALDRANSLWPLATRERLLRLALRVPGARLLLGRRAPYR